MMKTPRRALVVATLTGCALLPGGIWSTALATDSVHWRSVQPASAVPASRDGHLMVYDSKTRSVVLFGGKGSRSRCFNDLWAYSPSTHRWTQLRPSGSFPPGRFGNGLAYDTHRKELLVFGGVLADSTGPADDFWAYNDAANAWSRLEVTGPRPAARVYPSMAYDPTHHAVVLFGGWMGGTGTFGDTWIYDVSAKRWTKLAAARHPHARWGASMVYDPDTQTILLFGGLFGSYDGSHRLNDLWSYSPSTHAWHELHPSSSTPPSRGYAAMDYNSATHQLVLFGGFAGSRGLLADTWTYDPARNAWGQVMGTGGNPPGRDFSALAYDKKARQLVLFGGLTGSTGNVNGTLMNDTWTAGS